MMVRLALLLLLLATPAAAEAANAATPWFGCHDDPVEAEAPLRAASIQCLEGRVTVVVGPGGLNQKTLDRLHPALAAAKVGPVPPPRFEKSKEHPQGRH